MFSGEVQERENIVGDYSSLPYNNGQRKGDFKRAKNLSSSKRKAWKMDSKSRSPSAVKYRENWP